MRQTGRSDAGRRRRLQPRPPSHRPRRHRRRRPHRAATGPTPSASPSATDGAVPRRSASTGRRSPAAGFEGKVGQTLVVPRRDGPTVVAVGVGEPASSTAAGLRDAAAAFARAAGKRARPGDGARRRRPASTPTPPAQAVVEGVLLAGYRYGALKKEAPASELVERDAASRRRRGRRRRSRAPRRGARHSGRGPAGARPRQHAARRTSRRATWPTSRGRGRRRRPASQVEVFDEDALAALGCGGMLGVNAGSDRAAAHGQADVHAAATRTATSRSSARA